MNVHAHLDLAMRLTNLKARTEGSAKWSISLDMNLAKLEVSLFLQVELIHIPGREWASLLDACMYRNQEHTKHYTSASENHKHS